MIKQIKMSIKLLRYTFGMKMCIGLGVVFLLCGVAMSLMPEELGLSGSFFLIATAMWATQLFYSLSVSSLVQSSPYKKAAQTSMPAIISFLSFLGSYAVILLLKLPRLQTANAETQQYMAADYAKFFICTAGWWNCKAYEVYFFNFFYCGNIRNIIIIAGICVKVWHWWDMDVVFSFCISFLQCWL